MISKVAQLVNGHTASNECIQDCHQVSSSLVTEFLTAGYSKVPKAYECQLRIFR